MKLKIIFPIVVFISFFSSCKKHDTPGPVGRYAADVANAWMQMQIRLTRSTTGYNSVVSDRSFGYAGITKHLDHPHKYAGSHGINVLLLALPTYLCS
jgi:hypothetical protein